MKVIILTRLPLFSHGIHNLSLICWRILSTSFRVLCVLQTPIKYHILWFLLNNLLPTSLSLCVYVNMCIRLSIQMFVLACGEQSSLLFDFNNTSRYILKITFLRLLHPFPFPFLSPGTHIHSLLSFKCRLFKNELLYVYVCECWGGRVCDGETITENHHHQSVELWRPVTTDSSITKLLDPRLRDWWWRGGRNIVRTKGSVKLLWDCVSW